MVPALKQIRNENIAVNKEAEGMEEYTHEFIAEMQEIMKQEPIFIGTLEELDKFLDTLDCDE